MAKHNKPASAYAEPHTMSGQKTDVNTYSKNKTGKDRMNEMNISVGGLSKGSYPAEKTTGIKMRGAGAATKGTMCRGPMG